ncbi:MAG TPA: YfhO family protein [Clostridiales bacterium]|nr:YfhO family protein [Clostridiales bacterium]
MKKPLIKNTYLIYTLSFLLLLPIVFLPFILEGRSFVWHEDGLYQHYPLLQYYGKLLRGLLAGQGFPMVDYKLGLGFDTITTIHYYALGDPIALLTVFMTLENGAALYNILILLRFYLVGISFILFCRYWGKKGLGVSLGALLYTFCGYAYFAGLRHPFFLNPMIYLPLILLGLEKVLRKQKPYLLIIMVFITTMSNFYFFYMLSIIAVVYVIFRYFYVYYKSEKNIFAGFLTTGLRTGGYYLLGVAMAGILLIPMVYAFLQNGRLSSKPELATGFFHYDKDYYIHLVQAMFVPGVKLGYWVVLAFSSVAIISIAILFCNRKYRQLQIIFLLCFLGLLIPSFGYFMNGFAYLANRWVFLISFLIAITFTVTYDKLFQLERKEKLVLLSGLIIYGISAFLISSEKEVEYEFIIIFIVITSVIILQLRWFKGNILLQKATLYVLVLFTLGFNAYLLYSSDYNNYVDRFIDQNKVNSFSEKGALSLIPEIKDNSFYRIETYGENILNDSIRIGFNEVAGYYSIMDGDIASYFKDLELLNQRSAFRFDNLDNRTILDELENVKYFATTDKKAAPFGFQLINETKKDNINFYLFENQYSLPLGYVYDNYMLEEEYSKLTSLEKQSAAMDAVILKKESDYAKKINSNNEFGVEKLDVNIIPDKNVVINNDKIRVKKAEAEIVLEFKSNPNTETYVRFDNLKIKSGHDKTITIRVEGKNGVTKRVIVRNEYNLFYFGKQDYLVNLGYYEDGETKATITFGGSQTLYCDNIEVYSLDMNYYKAKAEELGKYSLTEAKVGNNSIQGDINLGQKGIMVFSIPYSSGWKAYVDGKITEIFRGNIMNMAIPLPEGEHHITLIYETPYLKVGSMVSAVAFLIFLGIVICNKKNIKAAKSINQDY